MEQELNQASGRIAVADDDAPFRSRLIEALERRGFIAWGVETPDELFELQTRNMANMFVLDLRLGLFSGLDLLREVLWRWPSSRVVMLTGYGSIAGAVEALRLGAVNYLAKPADAQQILAAFNSSSTFQPACEATLRPASLERVEWEHLNRVLADCGGNVTRAANALGMHRRSLQRKLSRTPPTK